MTVKGKGPFAAAEYFLTAIQEGAKAPEIAKSLREDRYRPIFPVQHNRILPERIADGRAGGAHILHGIGNGFVAGITERRKFYPDDVRIKSIDLVRAGTHPFLHATVQAVLCLGIELTSEGQDKEEGFAHG